MSIQKPLEIILPMMRSENRREKCIRILSYFHWSGGTKVLALCIAKEPDGTQKRKWRITLMRHVRRLQRKSVSQGILSLGLHDVTSYVRYDGGFALTRAAVSSENLFACIPPWRFRFIPQVELLCRRFARNVSMITAHERLTFEIQWFAVIIIISSLSQFIARLSSKKKGCSKFGINPYTHFN